MKFRQCSTTFMQMHYATTNESLAMTRKHLEGISVNRAAGICSGGEIGLFALLPVVKKQLILIDHTPSSMIFAMAKWWLIKNLGAKGAYSVITTHPQHKKLDKYWEAMQKEIPPKVLEGWEATRSAYRSNNTFRFIDEAGWSFVSNWWKNHLKVSDVQAIENKLDFITFVHGDLLDLKCYRPFELLYTSNALEYTNQKNMRLGMADLKPLVKPSGHILLVGGYDQKYDHKTLSLKPERAEAAGMWIHLLYRKQEELAAATV